MNLPFWVNTLMGGIAFLIVAVSLVVLPTRGDPDFVSRGHAVAIVLGIAGTIMVLVGVLQKKYRPWD